METDVVKKQEQRTFLRERFLRLLGAVTGEHMDVQMHEAKVSGTLMATDVEFNNIQVQKLTTPMGVLPHAQLRTLDIVSIKFPHLSESSSSPKT